MANQKKQPMKAKEIQELINFISDTGLEEVNIETEEFKLEVKRSSGNVVAAAPAAAPVAAPAPAAAPAPTPGPAAPSEASDAPAADNLVTIKSPMIGTFYRSSNPETPPFLNIGDSISVGQAVCIVEAMKLFNEIESDVSGKIVEVLVENAQPVEFDQPLFRVQPD